MQYITFTKVLGIAGLLCVLLLLYYGSMFWIIASLLYYKIVVGLFGNQIAQHRYFSHNSFKTTKTKKFFLYFVSLTTGINPFNYALSHRHHHIHSDKPEDIHSWKNSIWDIFSPITYKSSSTAINIKLSRVLDSDLMPFYKWHVYTITAVLAVAVLISWKFCLFILLAGVGWNYIHMILFRVFLVHAKLPGSYRNYENTTDNSYNNKFIVLLDIGEGLHNNHHAFPNKYDQATHPGEFDAAGWVTNKIFIINNYGDHSVKV